MTTQTIRRAVRQGAATSALAIAVMGGLLGLGGTAAASPVPGIPLTTAKLCTDGGGHVGPGPAGSQVCNGGGDTGDIIISDPAAAALVRTEPRPAKPQPDPPKAAPPAPASPKPAPPAPASPKPAPPKPAPPAPASSKPAPPPPAPSARP